MRSGPILALFLLCSAVFAQDTAYRASAVALIGANVADSASSWGRPELNPLLGRQFGWRGVAIKSAATGGLLYAQHRTPKSWRKLWTVANWCAAAGISVVVVRNYRVRR